MALRIGNKEVIKQKSFLITHGDQAKFDITLGGEALKVEVLVSQNQGKGPNFSGKVSNSTISLEFINWGDAVGVAMQEPVKVADTQNGRALWLLAMGKGVEKTVRLDLQFMIG